MISYCCIQNYKHKNCYTKCSELLSFSLQCFILDAVLKLFCLLLKIKQNYIHLIIIKLIKMPSTDIQWILQKLELEQVGNTDLNWDRI